MSHEIERRHRQRKATHAQRKTTTVNGDGPDSFVPDKVVREECGGISRMSAWRWDHDPAMAELGWPVRVMLNGRGHRSRQGLEKFKGNLMRRALADRGEVK